MAPGTPAAKIPDWRTRVKGAWLIKIGNKTIKNIDDVTSMLRDLVDSGDTTVVLLFSHPELRPNLSNNGLLIVSSTPFTQHVHDQLINRWEFTTVAEHLQSSRPTYHIEDSGGVLNVVNRVMKLTRGKLLKNLIGLIGGIPNIYNWINISTRVCLVRHNTSLRTMRCFILFGRTLLKPSMVERRRALLVMDHHDRARLGF